MSLYLHFLASFFFSSFLHPWSSDSSEISSLATKDSLKNKEVKKRSQKRKRKKTYPKALVSMSLVSLCVSALPEANASRIRRTHVALSCRRCPENLGGNFPADLLTMTLYQLCKKKKRPSLST
jgi:hypothetical protein